MILLFSMLGTVGIYYTANYEKTPFGVFFCRLSRFNFLVVSNFIDL